MVGRAGGKGYLIGIVLRNCHVLNALGQEHHEQDHPV